MDKNKALQMAIEALSQDEGWFEPEAAIKACKEALAQPAQEYLTRAQQVIRANNSAQEPVAWMRSALDNARDVCKYLDHDMIKEAKAHTKFFWNDIEKIKEPDTHPAPSCSCKDKK